MYFKLAAVIRLQSKQRLTFYSTGLTVPKWVNRKVLTAEQCWKLVYSIIGANSNYQADKRHLNRLEFKVLIVYLFVFSAQLINESRFNCIKREQLYASADCTSNVSWLLLRADNWPAYSIRAARVRELFRFRMSMSACLPGYVWLYAGSLVV